MNAVSMRRWILFSIGTSLSVVVSLQAIKGSLEGGGHHVI